MSTLDGILGNGVRETVKGLLAWISSNKKKLERSKEMDDVNVIDADLDIEKDVLREHISASSSECFSYVRKLGRPGDESHPILKIWADKIHPMGELAFDCKTIEEVDAMHKQLIAYGKEAQDIYKKELQTLGGPSR
ncbi:MAG: hypothetical protein LBL34_05140 [Clostridiales bacterium]|jgi:Na+/phosphate symporter|nr:hypothetical protein [Clostridiales bacterium]